MENPNLINTKFISYKDGGPENMFVDQRQLQVHFFLFFKVPDNHLLMKVKAIGINRAETLHRMGKYPIGK